MTGAGAGRVYLVGAGPGDPKLITVRGLECITQADAVVYDRLVSPLLVARRRPGAEAICVGKAPGGAGPRQEEINALLIRLARDGKTVVRLKGGDPLVFGRGGEEALELAAAGVPFEIIPGVTSAFAAPAATGIPVTHRGVASSVAVTTGHEDATKDMTSVDWAGLAKSADTLVVLMVVERLDAICQGLIAGGRPPETPAALIESATTLDERIIVSDLARLPDEAERQGAQPPAVLVVGEVVRLREALAAGMARPLAGRRILVTRPGEQGRRMAERLARLGAVPIHLPLIEVEPVAQAQAVPSALAELGPGDWLVFTSAHGVESAHEACRKAGCSLPRPSVRTAAVGPATADALREIGIAPEFVPTEFSVAALAEQLPLDAGVRCLLLRSEGANPILAERLRARGAAVSEVAIYATRTNAGCAEGLRSLLREGRVEAVTLTSASCARALAELLGRDTSSLLESIAVACIGPKTAEALAQAAGRPPDIVAEEYAAEGLIWALMEHFRVAGTPERDKRHVAEQRAKNVSP